MRQITQDTAAKVIQGLLSASEALNEALRLVQAEASEDVFEDYRRRTAEVIGAIYLDLVKPIASFYPELDPGREDDAGKQG